MGGTSKSTVLSLLSSSLLGALLSSSTVGVVAQDTYVMTASSYCSATAAPPAMMTWGQRVAEALNNNCDTTCCEAACANGVPAQGITGEDCVGFSYSATEGCVLCDASAASVITPHCSPCHYWNFYARVQGKRRIWRRGCLFVSRRTAIIFVRSSCITTYSRFCLHLAVVDAVGPLLSKKAPAIWALFFLPSSVQCAFRVWIHRF